MLNSLIVCRDLALNIKVRAAPAVLLLVPQLPAVHGRDFSLRFDVP